MRIGRGDNYTHHHPYDLDWDSPPGASAILTVGGEE